MLNQRKILRVLRFISCLHQGPSKSVAQIAAMLETTERTVYRYLDLLRECGFDVQKDRLNRYFIAASEPYGIQFTTEEAVFLKQLVLTAGKNNKLKDAVLSKIFLSSGVQISANHLVNAKNGRVIERLSQAIAAKEQVILKRYHSIHSESISDRLVEPFGFTDQYQTVMAFETISGKNKTFHVNRITDVVLQHKPFANEYLHQHQTPDAFGFSYNGMKHKIRVELPLKAYLLLKEEYPLTQPHIKYNSIRDIYELNMEVNDMIPIERFFKGLGMHVKQG